MADLIISTPVDDFLQAANKPAMRVALDLGNVNNTSDANKPVSTAQAAADAGVLAAAAADVDALDAATQAALATKANASALTAHVNDTANPHAVTKTQVGLGNADNTSDALKPVSSATQTALNLKAPLNSPALTGNPTAPTQTAGDNSTRLATTEFVTGAVAGGGGGNVSNSGTPTNGQAAEWTGANNIKGVDVSGTGSYLKGTSPAITTPTGIVKGDVGLGNADNTSDANKPVSTATQTALDLKAPLISPALSGTPTSPTAAPGTNTTQIASTAFVTAAVSLAVSGLLDFKGNIDASANPNYPAASKGDSYYISVAGKIGGASGKNVEIGDLVVANADNAGGNEATVGTSWFVLEHNLVGALIASNNLSDLANAGTARTNLGLGNADNTSDANKPVSTAQQTALNLKSNIASPTFTGTPAAPTAAVDTNTTQLATTAMVLAQAASATPVMDGTAVVGTSTRFARGDHVHPSDTSRAPLTAIGLQISLGLACSDMVTAIATGTNKAYFPAPFNGTLDEVFFASNTAPTGSTQIFDVNKNGTTMLSTRVTIDAGENSSLTAAVPPVISVITFSKGDFISVDFDQVGSSVAGLGIVAMFKLTRTS